MEHALAFSSITSNWSTMDPYAGPAVSRISSMARSGGSSRRSSLHFNLLHLLFNMWALAVLGSMIEYRRGTATLGASGLALGGGLEPGRVSLRGEFVRICPVFGGMSGVVYALFGYIWMKGQNEPEQGMILHPSTVQTMLFWLVVCMMGFVGNVANAAHVVGVAVGIVCGLAQL